MSGVLYVRGPSALWDAVSLSEEGLRNILTAIQEGIDRICQREGCP